MTREDIIARLEDNVLLAEARLARATERVEEARAAGIDTATYDPNTSAQSPEYTLTVLQARLDHAQKVLNDYAHKSQ